MKKQHQENREQLGMIECLKGIDDPRVKRTRTHKLIDVLVIGVCSMIAGGQSFNDMEIFGKAQHEWLRGFLELPDGIPSHDTFNRIFQAIEPKQFTECFVRWTESLRSILGGEVVAIDGKALRRARDANGRIPYIVSAWASESGLTLGQIKVDEKSNEITAIPKLLRLLDLAGCIVTIDAMGCQTKIAREIIQADADYLLALKGNQGTAEQQVRAYFDELIPPNPEMLPPSQVEALDFLQTDDKGHGRIETRRYWISEKIDWFKNKGKWKGLHCCAMVESWREIKGVRSYERRCFLTSIKPEATRFAQACRGHWGVENPLHWTMDVTFREDDSRARSGNAAENLAALRRLALNMLKADTSQPKISIRGRRLMAAWNSDYLQTILGI